MALFRLFQPDSLHGGQWTLVRLRHGYFRLYRLPFT
jgi:hypothetical protein